MFLEIWEGGLVVQKGPGTKGLKRPLSRSGPLSSCYLSGEPKSRESKRNWDRMTAHPQPLHMTREAKSQNLLLENGAQTRLRALPIPLPASWKDLESES